MKKNKRAFLIVEPTSKAFKRIANTLKNPQKAKKNTDIILSFPSYEVLGKIITGTRLELLATIRKNNPKSIQELARLSGRDFKNVYQDVKLLAEYGLIELEERGARKASCPIPKFTELLIAA